MSPVGGQGGVAQGGYAGWARPAGGIPLLVMKGLWLVENVYRDLKARHSGDIDLLVRCLWDTLDTGAR